MSADLEYRLTGGAANSDPDASLGGLMSSVLVSSTPMNNIFDNVLPEEAIQSVGYDDYRAIDIYNDGDATAESVNIWVGTPTPSTDSHLEIGYDTSTKDGSNPGSTSHTSSWNGETIANEDTAPASPSVSFVARYVSSELVLPDIPASEAIRVWFKRVIQGGADNIANDLATIVVRFA